MLASQNQRYLLLLMCLIVIRTVFFAVKGVQLGKFSLILHIILKKTFYL